MRALPFAALMIAGLALTGSPVLAADPIAVQLDQAKIYRLASPAGTIIIGNPSIADATLQDSQTLIITGHTYGQTNLIVLDTNGETIADTQVQVGAADENMVTVYRQGARFSLSCLPNCQPAVVPGDDPGFMSGAMAQAAAHSSSASAPAALTQSSNPTSNSSGTPQ